MDWSRAKTILIIVFIILDFFLAAQINHTIEEKSLFVQSGDVTNSQVQKLLKENQIRLAIKPQEIDEINPFIAQISTLNGSWIQDERGNYTKVFRNPIPIFNARHLQDILQKQIPYFQSYKRSTSTPFKITYLQHENGLPIFDGKIDVILTKNKIKSIQIIHYDATMIKKINLISFNNALYNLLYSDELSKFKSPTITKATLGYRARSNPNNPTDYYLMPYWRLTINAIQYIDVNALTGNIEVPEES